jgi:molybdopterin converting factor small subunit
MFKCKVPMFGISQEITDRREVEIELGDNATLSDVVIDLRRQVPGLVGYAILEKENGLVENFKFNVNGQFHHDDMDLKIHPGDRVALLIPITGG